MNKALIKKLQASLRVNRRLVKDRSELLEALKALTVSAKDAISDDPHNDWKHSCFDGIDLAESLIERLQS